MKKINSNAYVVDLPSDFDTSLSFNIEDLIAYKRPKFFPDNPLLDEPSPEPSPERPLLPPLPQIHPTHMAEQIDEIIDDQIVSTRDGGYHRFLVRWKGLPDSDNTWINRKELQRLDPDCLEHFESRGGSHSTELSFS